MTRPFVDTNVILRHLVYDRDHSPAATSFFERVWDGRIKAQTSMTVVFETVFTLERYYRVPRPDIKRHLLDLLRLPGLHVPGKRLLKDVMELYVHRQISFADAYHAVLVRRLPTPEIVSFDTDFDRIDGVRRLDPRDLLKGRAA